MQVLRSAADWSHGTLLEDSIQRECRREAKRLLINEEAYIGLIRESNHCIYLENQFCWWSPLLPCYANVPLSVRRD